MDAIILQAKEIRKTFYYPVQVTILKAFNFIVRKGETVAITGQIWSGKKHIASRSGHIGETLRRTARNSRTSDYAF